MSRMTPEEAELLHDGLVIISAHQRNDDAEVERLLQKFLQADRFLRLAYAFVYVVIVAAETRATGMGIPFQEALQSIEPRDDVVILDGLPVGPWDEALLLVSAVKRSGEEARNTRLSMDVPSAINITFRLAVSSLIDLTKVPQFASMSPESLADMLAKGLDEGHANG